MEVDQHGWIKKLDPDCFAETPILTGGHAPAGEYVCLYDGEGEVDFGASAKVVSRASGRIVVNIDAQREGTFLSIRATKPENPVRNIRVLMPGGEKSYKTEWFSAAFLNRWRGFGTKRSAVSSARPAYPMARPGPPMQSSPASPTAVGSSCSFKIHAV